MRPITRGSGECVTVIILIIVILIIIPINSHPSRSTPIIPTRARFGAFVQEGTVLNNYAHIFELLIRLRQASCRCHP